MRKTEEVRKPPLPPTAMQTAGGHRRTSRPLSSAAAALVVLGDDDAWHGRLELVYTPLPNRRSSRSAAASVRLLQLLVGHEELSLVKGNNWIGAKQERGLF